MSAAEPPARRRLRWLFIVAAIAVVVGIVVYRSSTFVSQPPPRRGRFQDGGNQPVDVARIGRGDIRLTLRALGAVTPLATVTVTTQINGLLMSVGFNEGQLVKKGQLLAQIDPRPYQVALEQDQAQLARDEATLKPTTVEFAVPEDSVPQVMERVRARAQLPVTAFDRANVTQLAIGQLGAVDTQVNSTTGTVMLRANFDNADERLFPSQFVNVVMLLDTLKDVVRVPVAAVQHGAPGTYVYLVDAQSTVSVHPIKLGAQDGDFYAVESGLSPGDVVVSDGADRLRDGATVSIPDKSQAPPPSSAPRAHARGQGEGNRAGGRGNGQHHHRPQGDESQPLPPGQPPAPVTPQPPAAQPGATGNSS